MKTDKILVLCYDFEPVTSITLHKRNVNIPIFTDVDFGESVRQVVLKNEFMKDKDPNKLLLVYYKQDKWTKKELVDIKIRAKEMVDKIKEITNEDS